MRIQAFNFAPSINALSTLSLLVFALLTAASAVAADKPKKEGSFGGGKSSGAFLTKDQLRDCFAQQDRMKEQGANLTKEQAAIVAMKTDITQTGDALKAQLDTVDRTNTEAVAAYRRLIALDPVWKDPAHLASLRGWTQRELDDLEQVRRALLTKK